jgi:hypothetical protein
MSRDSVPARGKKPPARPARERSAAAPPARRSTEHGMPGCPRAPAGRAAAEHRNPTVTARARRPPHHHRAADEVVADPGRHVARQRRRRARAVEMVVRGGRGREGGKLWPRGGRAAALVAAVEVIRWCTVDHAPCMVGRALHKGHHCFFFLTKSRKRCNPILGIVLKRPHEKHNV